MAVKANFLGLYGGTCAAAFRELDDFRVAYGSHPDGESLQGDSLYEMVPYHFTKGIGCGETSLLLMNFAVSYINPPHQGLIPSHPYSKL